MTANVYRVTAWPTEAPNRSSRCQDQKPDESLIERITVGFLGCQTSPTRWPQGQAQAPVVTISLQPRTWEASFGGSWGCRAFHNQTLLSLGILGRGSGQMCPPGPGLQAQTELCTETARPCHRWAT